MVPPSTAEFALDAAAVVPALPPSRCEGYRTVGVPEGKGRFWMKMGAFAGPGYLVAVGYMDPGNWATDLAGGSAFGYTLLSVILLSNLMAMVLQSLAAKLGIVTGLDLAQACAAQYGRFTRISLWLLCELAIVACDIAEVIGTAIALQLLFGIPMVWGVLLTAADVLLILYLQQRGFRRLEAFIIALLLIIAVCFAVNLALASPSLSAIVDYQKKVVARDADLIDDGFKTSLNLQLTLAAIALVTGAVFAWWIGRRITAPLEEAQHPEQP